LVTLPAEKLASLPFSLFKCILVIGFLAEKLVTPVVIVYLSLFFSLLDLFTILGLVSVVSWFDFGSCIGLSVFRFHLFPAHLFVVRDVAVVQHYSSFLPVCIYVFRDIFDSSSKYYSILLLSFKPSSL